MKSVCTKFYYPMSVLSFFIIVIIIIIISSSGGSSSSSVGVGMVVVEK